MVYCISLVIFLIDYHEVQALIQNFLWGKKSAAKAVSKVAWMFWFGQNQRVDWDWYILWCIPVLWWLSLWFGDYWLAQMYGNRCSFINWCIYVLHQLMHLHPSSGGQWSPSLKWIFLANIKTPTKGIATDNFLLGIICAWNVLKPFSRTDVSRTWDRWLNQPLLANALLW